MRRSKILVPHGRRENMQFTCPYCGKGSFTIVSDAGGSSYATCNSCGKTTPFEKQQMTNGPVTEIEPLTQKKAG
jgi:transcription elongation factor Elf1